MKIIYEYCEVKNYMKEDHRSYRRNFCSCQKKAWKNSGLHGFEPLASAIPVQRSTNQLTSMTGSRSLNWFVLNQRKDDDEVTNIWKSCMRTAGKTQNKTAISSWHTRVVQIRQPQPQTAHGRFERRNCFVSFLPTKNCTSSKQITGLYS